MINWWLEKGRLFGFGWSVCSSEKGCFALLPGETRGRQPLPIENLTDYPESGISWRNEGEMFRACATVYDRGGSPGRGRKPFLNMPKHGSSHADL